MILQINRPYGLNLGEDFEFICNYYKGKKTTYDPSKIRTHFRGVNTNTDILMYFESDAFGLKSIGNLIGGTIGILYFNNLKVIEEGRHYKNKNYNYYYLDNNPLKVVQWLRMWKNTNPAVHIGDLTHMRIDNIQNYSWTYRFNNETF